MKRLLPILILLSLAAAGCKSSQWTFSKNWGGGQATPTDPRPDPAPRPQPEPAPPGPKPEPQTPKDVIFVLGINGMD